jgi:hypothetical protein
MAATTQLFYDVNFFHDWYYDSGFDEASGNAQLDDYGRGGIDADPIHAEAQDSSGTNNANMSTPSDGGSPRMQMYVWTPNSPRNVTATPPGATYASGLAQFGPSVFDVTTQVVLVNDGVSTTTDGCGRSEQRGREDRAHRRGISLQAERIAGRVGVIVANASAARR